MEIKTNITAVCSQCSRELGIREDCYDFTITGSVAKLEVFVCCCSNCMLAAYEKGVAYMVKRNK